MRESASTDLREPQGSNPLGPPGPELPQVLGNLGLVRSAWASRGWLGRLKRGRIEKASAAPGPKYQLVLPNGRGCSRSSLAFALEGRDPPGRRALRCSNQKSTNSDCLFPRPLLALIRTFSALHCSRAGRLVRLSLTIERASCLVVHSRA